MIKVTKKSEDTKPMFEDLDFGEVFVFADLGTLNPAPCVRLDEERFLVLLTGSVTLSDAGFNRPVRRVDLDVTWEFSD